MRPQQAEPLAVAGGRADRQTGGAVGVVVIVGLGGVAVLAPCDPGERGLDLGLAQLGQAGAGGSVGGDGGQALLHVAACFLTWTATSASRPAPASASQVTAGDEVVGQAPGLVAGPGLEGERRAGPGRSGRSEARAIRRGDGGRRRRSWHGSDRRRSIGRRPRPPGPARDRVASGRLSQVRHAFASVRAARRRTAAIASGWVRHLGSKLQTWTNTPRRALFFVRLVSQVRVPWSGASQDIASDMPRPSAAKTCTRFNSPAQRDPARASPGSAIASSKAEAAAGPGPRIPRRSAITSRGTRPAAATAAGRSRFTGGWAKRQVSRRR